MLSFCCRGGLNLRENCMMSGSFLPLQWMIGSLFGTLAPSSYKGELYNMNEELDDTYKAVFRQCYPKLLFYATRLVGTEEAEDVVQDVFVELWRRRDSVVIGEQISFPLSFCIYQGYKFIEASGYREQLQCGNDRNL